MEAINTAASDAVSLAVSATWIFASAVALYKLRSMSSWDKPSAASPALKSSSTLISSASTSFSSVTSEKANMFLALMMPVRSICGASMIRFRLPAFTLPTVSLSLLFTIRLDRNRFPAPPVKLYVTGWLPVTVST